MTEVSHIGPLGYVVGVTTSGATALFGAREVLGAVPKVELHLHLEGSIRPELLLELAEGNGIDIGARSVEDLAEHYKFRDFDHFIELYLVGMSAIRSGEDLLKAIDALARELASQNVRYAEVTTTAYAHHANGMPEEEYRQALDVGARRARVLGVDLRWIVDIPRSVEDPEEQWTAGFLTGPRAPDDVVAIGLGGPEAQYPPQWYAESFERAAAAGIPPVLHAGEVAGPHSVWKALELGTRRVGHGVRSMEDPGLVEHLVATQVPVEVSVTSNVLLGVCPTIGQHPLPQMLRAGINVSLNTDDPAYFSTTLVDELVLAHEALGISVAELIAAERRAVDAALCDQVTKDRLRGDLEEFSYSP